MREELEYSDSERVTILMSTLKKLEDRDYWLQCLEDAGVDNWEGMEEAIKVWHENVNE